MLGPGSDISFVEEARGKFLAESAYLDDRPGAPMRFLGRSEPDARSCGAPKTTSTPGKRAPR